MHDLERRTIVLQVCDNNSVVLPLYIYSSPHSYCCTTFISLPQTDLTKRNAEIEALKAEKKELTASLSLENDKGEKSSKQVETLEAICATLRSDVSRLKSESKVTLEETARRSTEIEMLGKHLKDDEGVILDLQQRLNQAQEKQWEASGIGSQAVREVDILKKQVSGLENHCRSLSEENEARAAELLSSRKASVQASFSLKLKLTEAEEKASSSLTELSRVKKQLNEVKRMATDIGEELKDARKSHATEREGMEKELSAAKRISDLYKARGEEAEEQLQREVSEGATRVNSLRELIQVQKEQAKDVLMKAKAEAESIIERQSTELVKVKVRVRELEDLEKQRQQQLQHHVPQSPESSAPMVKKGGVGTVHVALLGRHHPSSFSSVADMQDRIVEAEEALGKERAERRRLERFLNRVLSEVESKAPIIASQKLDYRRALASHEHISSRLEESMVEIRELEGEARIARTEKDSAEREVTSLKQTAADLGLQVQVLLRQQLKDNLRRGSSGAAIVPADDFPNGGGSLEPSAVISQHLVSFHDVAELQQRNKQLLRVVRKLSEERVSVEKANMDASAAADAAALAESMRELEDLKRARARQEEMVAAIVEQRDMYRLLLAQESQKILTETSSGMNVNGGVGSEADGGIKELSRKLVETESEVRRMTEECEKRNASEADANKGLKDAVDDAAGARREAAHATAEATFARCRYQDLMNTLEQRQSEVETLHKELVTLNALQLSLQRDLEGARADVDSERARAQSLDRANVCLSAELSSINQTYERLKDENLRLRQSSQRQESLMDSLQRLERGFTARVAEERSALEESNRSLRNSLEESINELTEVKAQLSALETQNVENMDARKERTIADEAKAAAAEAREALLREQAESRVLREKVEGLEKQLPSGNKLSGGTSKGQQQQLADEGGRPAPSADWSFRVMKAQAAAEEAKEAEVAARNHMKQYQAIAKGKETQLKEFTEALAKSRAAHEDDKKAAEKKEEEMREEMRKERERTRPLLNGLVEAEKASDVAKREAQTKVADAKAELDSAKRANEQLERQISDMKREVKQLQEAISSVQENYDRELHEHSEAISRLREAEERGSMMRKSRDYLEEINSKLAEELVKFQAEQKTSEADIRGRMEVALEESKALRAQNDLLHSQLSSLAKESEAVMRDRHNRAEAAADAAAAASADVTEQKEGEDNNVVMVEEVSNEVAVLRKSLSDLREVVRFLRREREVSEAEKQTAEAQVGRLKASLTQAQVALRSARAELRSIAEEKAKEAVGEEGGGISESEHAKLVAQATQLSTLRESNTLLRSQLQEAHGKLARLTATVASLEKSVEPAKLAEENLKASLAEVEAELGVRKREVESWRQRAAMLVQDYQKIDPEDHKKLQSELETAIRDCKVAQARVKDAEDEGKQALVRQRATAQSHQNKLQQMIRSEREKHLKEKEELVQERAAAIAKAEVEATARAEAVKESNPSDTTAKNEELDSLKKEHQNLKKHLEHEKKMGEKLRMVARNIRTKLAAEEKKTKVLEEKIATTGPTQSLATTTTTTTVEHPLITPSAVPSSTAATLDVSNWNAGPSHNETPSAITISADDAEPGQIQTSTGGESTTCLSAASPATGLPISMLARKLTTSAATELYSTPTGTGTAPVVATATSVAVSGEEGTGGAELKKAGNTEGSAKRAAAPNLAATQSQEQQLMKKRKQGEPQQQSTMQDSSNFPSFLSAPPSSQPPLLFGALASESQAKKSTDFVAQTQLQQKQQQLQKNEEDLAEAVAAAKAAEAVATLRASSNRMFTSLPAPSGGPASSEAKAKATAPLLVKGTTSLASPPLNLGGFGSSPTLQSSMFGQGSAFVPTTTTASLSAAHDTGVTSRTIGSSSSSTFTTAPTTSMKFGSGFGTIRAPQGIGGTAGEQHAVAGGDSFVFLPPTTGGKAPTFGASSLPVPVPSPHPHSPGQKRQEWPSSSVPVKGGGHTAVASSTTTLNLGATASAGITPPHAFSKNNESILPGSGSPPKLAAQEAEAFTLPSAEGSYPRTGDQVAPHDTRSTQARSVVPSSQFTTAPAEEGEIIESEGGAQRSLPVVTTTGPTSVVSAKPPNVSRPASIMSNQERMVLRQKRFGGGAEGSGGVLFGSSAVGEAVDSTTGSLRDPTVLGSESKEAGGTQIDPASDVQKFETIAGEGGGNIESTPAGGGDVTPAGEPAHDRSK